VKSELKWAPCCDCLFLVSPQNNPVVNKQEEQSPSAHHMTGGRLVHIYQASAHSQVVVTFNNHFCVIYWPGDYTVNCIMCAVLVMNLLILSMK
jgi:hypothetical protein